MDLDKELNLEHLLFYAKESVELVEKRKILLDDFYLITKR